MIRFFSSIFIFLLISSTSSAETRVYGDVHVGLTKESGGASELRIIDRSSYIGIKGVTPLDTGLLATYKFEVGADITNHFTENSSYIHYSFAGLKGSFGEFRVGRQDSAYDLVDNSMDNFLTEQGNGLVSEGDTANLIAFIRKSGSIGFYATYSPSSEDKVANSSLMINYASGALYTGLGFIKEKGGKGKQGTKLVITYKKDNYGFGFIHEKCPSIQNKTANQAVKDGCTGKGDDHINHFSAIYSFGNPYLAAQYARNSKENLTKSTLELGTILGKGVKTYLELDKTGSKKATTLGLRYHF